MKCQSGFCKGHIGGGLGSRAPTDNKIKWVPGWILMQRCAATILNKWKLMEQTHPKINPSWKSHYFQWKCESKLLDPYGMSE